MCTQKCTQTHVHRPADTHTHTQTQSERILACLMFCHEESLTTAAHQLLRVHLLTGHSSQPLISLVPTLLESMRQPGTWCNYQGTILTLVCLAWSKFKTRDLPRIVFRNTSLFLGNSSGSTVVWNRAWFLADLSVSLAPVMWRISSITKMSLVQSDFLRSRCLITYRKQQQIRIAAIIRISRVLAHTAQTITMILILLILVVTAEVYHKRKWYCYWERERETIIWPPIL